MVLYLKNDGDVLRYRDVAADVERLEQQTSYFCGAACSAMVLKANGVIVTQPDAYASIHNSERFKIEKLYSDPKGIADFMNERLDGDINKISVCVSGSFEAALGLIFGSISFHGNAAIALVQDGNHWVVVDEIRVVETEQGEQRAIGVFVENPWYGRPPRAYVSIEEFELNWLRPNRWGVTWKDQFVSVGALTSKRVAKPMQLSRRTSMLHAMTAADPLSVALARLGDHGFENLSEIQGGGAAVQGPVRVSDDVTSTYYWIVPIDGMRDKAFSDFLFAAIDDITGNVLEVAKMGSALDLLSEAETRQRLSILAPASHIGEVSELLWVRSPTTMSRFDVCRRVEVDGEQLLLTIDGIKPATVSQQSFGG